MQRTILSYVWLFILAILLQVLIFNNIKISTLISPQVYPLFILLLPVSTPQLTMLIISAVLGTVMDLVGGGEGLYTISIVAAAMTRSSILATMIGRLSVVEGTAPTPRTIGGVPYLLYVIIFVSIYLGIYTFIETLGIDSFNFKIARFFTNVSISSIFILMFLGVINGKQSTYRR